MHERDRAVSGANAEKSDGDDITTWDEDWPSNARLSRLEKAVAYQGVLLEKLRDSVDSVHQILPRPTEYGWKSLEEYEEALRAMVGDVQEDVR